MRQLPETIIVARIGRCHGVRGAVTVEPHSDVDDRFAEGSELLVLEQEMATEALRSLTIERAQVHKGRLLVSFEGIADRESAESLRGRWLAVPLRDVPAAEEGSYYHFELIGCEVFDRHGERLGAVQELIEDGGGLLIEVAALDADGRAQRTYLIPFVKAFLTNVDIDAGRIDVDLPPGLLEACVSTS